MVTPSIGLESLVQRGRSAFYNDLVVLYQKTQNALRSNPNSSERYIATILKSMDFSSSLKTIIIEHTGLPISKVVVVPKFTINLMVKIRVEELGAKRKRDPSNLTPGMIAAKIARVYDDRAGVVDKSVDLSDVPFSISMIVFTGIWQQDVNNNFLLTPEEIAGFTLHEVGHVDDQIKTAFQIRRSITDASDIIDYVNKTPDRDIVLALIKSLKSSKALDGSWKKTLAITEQYFQTSNTVNDSVYFEALSVLSTIVAAESAGNLLQKEKQILDFVSQRLQTQSMKNDSERSADDYAARHGNVAAHVQGHKRFEDLMWKEGFKDYYKLKTGEDASLLVQLQIMFVTLFLVPPSQLSAGYDPANRRLEIMIETAKHAFHDDLLPPEIAEEIKSDIAKAEEILKDFNNTEYQKIRSKIQTWKDAMEKFGRVLKSPIQNRLSQDYSRLQDANRSLTRNSLYYLAKK